MKKLKERYNRSGTLQDVVSNRTPFLVRWSNLFFLLIFSLIGLVGWFIRYPELIDTQGEAVSKDQSVVIRLRNVDTKTARILVNQKATVTIYSPTASDSTSTTGVIDKDMIIRFNGNEFRLATGRFYDLKIKTGKISLLERIYVRLF